jgi:hypothetical protein
MIAPASVPASSLPFNSIAPPNIVDRVSTFVKRFVFLKDPSLYRLIALWIIHTHLIDEFDYTPYLFVHSPERGCGKTCLLSVLDLLVFKSSGITASPTEAVIFRSAHGHTQILDEADTYLPRLEAAKGILNAGYYRQGRVQRIDKDKKGKFTVQEFPVFAARVIAGIGSHILPLATRDRAFSIEMTRQIRSEKRERFRPRTLKTEVEALRNSIDEWVKGHKEDVAARYTLPFPPLDRFQDRTIDISEPIATILEIAYASEATLPVVRLEFLHSISFVRSEQTEESLDHRILGALLQACEANAFLCPDSEETIVGSATELALVCSNQGVSCDDSGVSRALRQYGFETRSVRVDGEPRKRYVLSQQALSELSIRYLGSNVVEVAVVETAGATTC